MAILEGDDFWPPDKLESLIPAFEHPETVLAYGFACLVTKTGRTTHQTVPPQYFFNRFTRSALCNDPVGAAAGVMAHFEGGTFTYPCTVIIRARALNNICGFQRVPGLPFTDYPTFLHLTLQGRYFFTPKIMGVIHPIDLQAQVPLSHANGTTQH